MGLLLLKKEDFWFLLLGGIGEIGMNFNFYGYDDSWLMVDCGVLFDEFLIFFYKYNGDSV